jgi:hypothetical protein
MTMMMIKHTSQIIIGHYTVQTHTVDASPLLTNPQLGRCTNRFTGGGGLPCCQLPTRVLERALLALL